MVLADGLYGKDSILVKAGPILGDIAVASTIHDVPAMVVCTHTKGHINSGYAGALKNLAMGLLAGLLLGVLLAFVLEFLDDTLKTPEDLEQRLRLPVLGIIPKLGPKQSIADVAGDTRSAFSEAYRSVRTALQFATDHGVPRSLLAEYAETHM